MHTVHSIDLIVSDPDVRNGRPIIAGTRLEVSVIAIAKIAQGKTPEQIAEDYAVTLPQVYAALAYYYANKAEMDNQIRQQRQQADTLKEQLIASGHTPLHRRESES